VTTYVHMTVLAVRYETGSGRRFAPQDESRRIEIELLRERIERDAYSVDPHKVADAIVQRLLAESRRDQKCS
jgi:anti-sigma28 factor (negative regulator of flagellin synthesis)